MSKCFASAVIAIAKQEVGYKEKASNSQLDSKTANAGHANWNKYAAFIDSTYPDFYNGKKNGYNWCDIFVDYCFLKAFGREDAQRLLCQPSHSAGAGCTASYGYYKLAGRACRSPTVGAQIFYTKDGKSSYHTGIVVKVENGLITTIEGNAQDGVMYKTVSAKSGLILGYGVPDYDEEVGNMGKSITEIAQEVISGKWGNGSARTQALTAAGYEPSKVQEEVNRICAGAASSSVGDYTVTVPSGVKRVILLMS